MKFILCIYFSLNFVFAYFNIFDGIFQKNQKENQESFYEDWLREKFQSGKYIYIY